MSEDFSVLSLPPSDNPINNRNTVKIMTDFDARVYKDGYDTVAKNVLVLPIRSPGIPMRTLAAALTSEKIP